MRLGRGRVQLLPGEDQRLAVLRLLLWTFGDLGDAHRNGERSTDLRLATAHVRRDSARLRHRAEQAVFMGVLGAGPNRNLHYLRELGHEMSEEEAALPIEKILGSLLAAWKCACYDWLGKWHLKYFIGKSFVDSYTCFSSNGT